MSEQSQTVLKQSDLFQIPVFQAPIESLGIKKNRQSPKGISTHTRHALLYAQIRTIADLLPITEADLVRNVDGLGTKGVAEINQALRDLSKDYQHQLPQGVTTLSLGMQVHNDVGYGFALMVLNPGAFTPAGPQQELQDALRSLFKSVGQTIASGPLPDKVVRAMVKALKAATPTDKPAP